MIFNTNINLRIRLNPLAVFFLTIFLGKFAAVQCVPFLQRPIQRRTIFIHIHPKDARLKCSKQRNSITKNENKKWNYCSQGSAGHMLSDDFQPSMQINDIGSISSSFPCSCASDLSLISFLLQFWIWLWRFFSSRNHCKAGKGLIESLFIDKSVLLLLARVWFEGKWRRRRRTSGLWPSSSWEARRKVRIRRICKDPQSRMQLDRIFGESHFFFTSSHWNLSYWRIQFLLRKCNSRFRKLEDDFWWGWFARFLFGSYYACFDCTSGSRLLFGSYHTCFD